MKKTIINGIEFWISENGKQYTVCPACGKFVQMNKPIFGSMHLCASDSQHFK